MDMHASLFPAEVKATGDEKTISSYKVDLRMDNSVVVHLKLEQARSLWHELGAVLQSLDHDAGVEVPAEIVPAEPAVNSRGESECVNCRRPICWSPLTGDWYHVGDLSVNCAGSSDEWPKVATPAMAISKSDSIRNLEDLRGLPHSSDLESHPSNSRR